MELTDLHVGRQLNIVSNLPSGIPGPGNLAQGTDKAAVPGSVWADGHLHVGMPVFAPLETAVGFTRPPVYNVKAAAVKSIVTITSRGFTPTPIDVVVGTIEGPVGVAAHALVVNMIVDTKMSIVSPLTNHVGTFKKIGLDTLVGTEITKAVRAIFAKEVKTGAMVSNGARSQNGVLANIGKILNPVSVTPVVVGKATGNKSFDIPHATKKGKRIRHVCAEGPEAGIYIRGKLNGSNIIELPEYWKELVDYDTITVTLTPFGRPDKSLYVKDIDEDKITISSDHLTNVKCFYEVWVARYINPENHDEKLHVVYEGESPADYPDNNDNFIIGGYQ
jgi:hypothetical protein